jgi:hypothetical protein
MIENSGPRPPDDDFPGFPVDPNEPKTTGEWWCQFLRLLAIIFLVLLSCVLLIPILEGL